MNRHLSLFAFILGALAVVWVASGYIGGSTLALTVCGIIALVYVAGALEMRRFQENTAALARALGNIPDDIAHLGAWLQQLPVALQNAVRLRIEGERVALPGPALTPYLTGLLVLLGMLGTFLGMVVTLKSAVLALEGSTDLQTIRAALAAPVRGLGVAFGTSIAGVATSAMLGLISALGRRDRLHVGLLLDGKIAGVLRDFSFSHQRQETFKALQTQAQALPELVGKLDTLMRQMNEQSGRLGEQLLAGQQGFHEKAKESYGELARAVDQSLKTSLRDSALLAAQAIEPVVTATMAGIASEARALNDTVFATVERQLGGVADRYAQTADSLSERWTDALTRHEQATDAQQRQLQSALTAYAETFEQRSAALLASVDSAQARVLADAAQQQASLAATTRAGQQQLAGELASQFDGVSARLDQAVNQLAENFAQGSQALLSSLGASHAAFAQATDERQAAQARQVASQLDATAERFSVAVQTISERLGGVVQTVADSSAGAFARHEEASDRLIGAFEKTQARLAETFARRSSELLADLRATQSAWQSGWAAGEESRQTRYSDALGALAATLAAQWQQSGEAARAQQESLVHAFADSVRDLSAASRRQTETTIIEVERLMQACAEAPRAAAEIIGELRHELSAGLARDNGLLAERSRIMETLATLLDAINHASTEQRSAIDALVASSTELLERVGRQFGATLESEAGKLIDIGTAVAGGALEVASVSESFGHAVQLFGDSNDKLMATLQRIEAGLAKSLSRSDEQLAYYVAQAREIIDLSIMSQKKMVDDLQRVARGEA